MKCVPSGLLSQPEKILDELFGSAPYGDFHHNTSWSKSQLMLLSLDFGFHSSLWPLPILVYAANEWR